MAINNSLVELDLVSKPLIGPFPPEFDTVPTGTDMVMLQMGISKPSAFNGSPQTGFAFMQILDWTLKQTTPVNINNSLWLPEYRFLFDHTPIWNMYRTSANGGNMNVTSFIVSEITYTNIHNANITHNEFVETFYLMNWKWRDCGGPACIALGVDPITGVTEPVVMTGLNQQNTEFTLLPLAVVPMPAAAAMGAGLFGLVGLVHVVRRRRRAA